MIAREWRCPGLNFLCKRTPDKNQPSKDTKKRRGTWGGRGGSTGDRGRKNATPPPGTGRGLGRLLRPAGGCVCACDGDGGSQSEELTLGRENPGVDREPGTG